MDGEGDGAAQSRARARPLSRPVPGWWGGIRWTTGLSLLLTCQHGSDQPVRLLEPLGPRNTWSPEPGLTHSGPAWVPLWLQAVFLQQVPLCSLPPHLGTGCFCLCHPHAGRSRPPPGPRSLITAWAHPLSPQVILAFSKPSLSRGAGGRGDLPGRLSEPQFPPVLRLTIEALLHGAL